VASLFIFRMLSRNEVRYARQVWHNRFHRPLLPKIFRKTRD